MTEQQPSGSKHGRACDTRLGTRISAGVDARLRQFALVRRGRLSHVLDEVLDAALPAAEDLAAQLTRLASTDGASTEPGAPGDRY